MKISTCVAIVGMIVLLTIAAIQVNKLEEVEEEVRTIEINFTDNSTVETPMITEQEILGNCSNMTQIATAKCLHKYVKMIYKYNETNDFVVLKFSELRDKGGDCGAWAHFYCRMLRKLKLNCRWETIPINSKYRHATAINYGEEGYVVLDQFEMFIFKYGEDY